MQISRKVRSLIRIVVPILILIFTTGCSNINNNIDNKKSVNITQPINANSNSLPASEGSQSSNSTSEIITSQLDHTKKDLVTNIINLAKERKVINCDFPARKTVIEDVEKKWGKPKKAEWVAAVKGTYATYPNKNVVFGFNKVSQIFEVRSFDNKIKKITLSDVKNILGTPAYELSVKGEEIIGYVVSSDFKILMVFPEPSSDDPNPLMDHYSVFYPKGTINSMADDPGREW